MQIRKQDVAVIGMSGCFPQAPDLSQFYLNLLRGVDSVQPVPPKRLELSQLPLNRDYLLHGFVDGVELFDHAFFNISKREAELMHPEQRIILQLSARAIENSGYSLEEFSGSNTAVILAGDTNNEYFSLSKDSDPTRLTGNLNAVTAGRVSYCLNLNGPAMMIDTTCSSSLVAVFEAYQKIVSGQVDYALAGGFYVHVIFHELSKYQANIGITSPDGKSKTFDAAANGTGGGEGGGIVLLKSLARAIEDRDNIHAIIRGGAINHQGSRSNGITAPSPKAQTEVIKNAWRDAATDPLKIRYIEAHGTGTKLGDPIEFQGITEAFKEITSARRFCAVSSVKTNIGHLGKAAGIAGLIKAILSLKHRVFFPSLHFHTPNPLIDFVNTAAYVNTAASEWKSPDGSTRVCGISSFGINGTNAHVILEEAPEQVNGPHEEEGEIVLKISGRTPSALITYAKDILKALKDATVSRMDVAKTLNTGRSDHPFRVAFSASSYHELKMLLDDFAKSSPVLKPSMREKQVVLLLADNSIGQEEVEYLGNRLPGLQRELALMQAGFPPEKLKGKCLQIITQFALYKVLKALGLNINTIIATGYAKITQRVIGGTVQLKDIVAECEKAEYDAPLDETKLRVATEALAQDQTKVFVELCIPGIFVKALLNWPHTKERVAPFLAAGNRGPTVNVAGLYNKGLLIDWKAYYALRGEQVVRVEAPTYPFEGSACWVQPAFAPSQSVDDWFYELKWVKDHPGGRAPRLIGATAVIFTAENQLSSSLQKKLSRDNNAVIVLFGSQFTKHSKDLYEIRVDELDDYQRLQTELAGNYETIDTFVHLGDYDGASGTDASVIAHGLTRGLNSHTLAVKAFHYHLTRKNTQIMFVSANGCAVENEKLMAPVHAISSGFVKGLLAEYQSLKVCHADFIFSEAPAELDLISDCILRELTEYEQIRFVAYRESQRFIQFLSKAAASPETKSAQIIEGGTYLISGGASGIGLEIARALARPGVRLLIIGRAILPNESEWTSFVDTNANDRRGTLIRNLLELQDKGVRISYHAMDVAERSSVSDFFDTIKQSVEKIDGIIHCAGVKSEWLPTAQKSLAEIERVLRPKVYGTINMETLSRPLNRGFFVCFSSLNAIVAQKNTADYAAANAFCDAFARHRNGNVISINWPGWKNTGMSGGAGRPSDASADIAIDKETGVLAFVKLLTKGIVNPAVINVDLSSFRINPYFVLDATEVFHKSNSCAPKSDDHQDWTVTQRKLQSIWKEVLKADDIALDADFFDLGGHSLNATQVLNRVEKEFGVTVEFDDLLEFGTIAALAKLIGERLTAHREPKGQQLGPAPSQSSYDLSPSQKRIWLAHERGADKHIFNMPGAVELIGPLKYASVDAAYQQLILRHESLRSNIVSREGHPQQVVREYSPAAYYVDYIDLSQKANNESLAIEIVKEEALYPFHLEREPLFRFRVIILDLQRVVLLFNIHHIFSDAWSYGVLISDFVKAYNSHASGQPPKLPVLPVQYKDCVYWLNHRHSDDARTSSREYWHKKLPGIADDKPIATDFPRKKTRAFEGEVVIFSLDPRQTETLKALVASENSTLYMGLVTLVKILLYRVTGHPHVAIGSPVAGRDRQEFESQIGLFINTVALRTSIAADDTMCTLLQKVKSTVVDGFRFAAYPIDSIIEDLGLSGATRTHPLFDVMVQLLNADTGLESRIQMSGITTKPFMPFDAKSHIDLYFTFSEVSASIQCSLVYDRNLFKAETIDALTNYFMKLTDSLLTNQALKIGEVDFLSDTGPVTSSTELDAVFKFDL